MSDGVRKMPESAEAAWRLGGWVALCALVRADAICSGWYACPACGGSGRGTPGRGRGEVLERHCDGCQGDGYRRVCMSWVNRPATPAWAKL